MRDIGYNKYDDNAADVFDNFQIRARQLLIEATRKNLEENLELEGLNKHDVFLVSADVFFSLVTGKRQKKTDTLAIDETRLMEAFSKMAYARRYRTQASASVKNHSTLVEDIFAKYYIS